MNLQIKRQSNKKEQQDSINWFKFHLEIKKKFNNKNRQTKKVKYLLNVHIKLKLMFRISQNK
jgi:hypothetical protein